MPRTPLERYQSDIESGLIIADEAQAKAVSALQGVYERVTHRVRQKPSLRARIFGPRSTEPLIGLYMWGGVGRGKTYLMDSFYESLDFDRKLRLHFNRFMQRVHSDLTELSGEKNPLDIVANRIADETVVLCFDEFYVSDIGDAMLLGGLMQKLFDRGICLVATSNLPPDKLYKDGLQRSRFLPAIAAVELCTQVLNVDSGIDYRLRVLTQSELYFVEEGVSGTALLEALFTKLSGGKAPTSQALSINKRSLQVLGASEGVLMADFAALCLSPRSAADYTQLAREYHSVLIADVPLMTTEIEDGARRFVTLIDEFYDRNIKIAIGASVSMESLYNGTKLVFEFQRTLSRLIEMQSVEYLGREHRP